MRIAVCLSSQLRTGLQAHENIKRYLGDLLPFCTFFAHTWNINTRKLYTHINETQEPPPQIIDPSTINAYKNVYNILDCNFKVEDYEQTKLQFHEHFPHWIPLYYSWVESLKLMDQYEINSNTKFDLIIKCRPDIIFPAERTLSSELFKIFLTYGQDNVIVENLIPHWRDKNSEHMNDVVWISKPNIMRLAAKFYQRSLNKEVNGLLMHLKEHNIDVVNLDQNGRGYGILREECLQYDPMTQYKECFDCEVYHFNPK